MKRITEKQFKQAILDYNSVWKNIGEMTDSEFNRQLNSIGIQIKRYLKQTGFLDTLNLLNKRQNQFGVDYSISAELEIYKVCRDGSIIFNYKK